MGLWYWITAELKALGLRCVVYGPEFWLAVAAFGGMATISAGVGYFIWRE